MAFSWPLKPSTRRNLIRCSSADFVSNGISVLTGVVLLTSAPFSNLRFGARRVVATGWTKLSARVDRGHAARGRGFAKNSPAAGHRESEGRLLRTPIPATVLGAASFTATDHHQPSRHTVRALTISG